MAGTKRVELLFSPNYVSAVLEAAPVRPYILYQAMYAPDYTTATDYLPLADGI